MKSQAKYFMLRTVPFHHSHETSSKQVLFFQMMFTCCYYQMIGRELGILKSGLGVLLDNLQQYFMYTKICSVLKPIPNSNVILYSSFYWIGPSFSHFLLTLLITHFLPSLSMLSISHANILSLPSSMKELLFTKYQFSICK